MKTIKVLVTCTVDDVLYKAGTDIKPISDNYELIDRLNLKGFITPLTIKQLNYIKNNKNIKK